MKSTQHVYQPASSSIKKLVWTLTALTMWSLWLMAPWGCGPTPAQPDGGESIADKGSADKVAVQETQPQETPVEVREGTSPDVNKPPQDLTERLPAGLARAGILTSAAGFVGGPNAQEKVGDIKLYNSKVAFTVAGKRRTNGYLSYGGKIVAADVIRPQGTPGRSMFQEFSLAYQHRMMAPEDIEIVNDGRDGKDAVVRLTGRDAALPLLLSYIKAVSPTFAKDTGDLGFSIVMELRLAPDGEELTIKTTLTNTGKEYQSINFAEVGFFMGDGLQSFFPQKGFIDKNTAGKWDYHGLAGTHVGYVVYPKQGEDFQLLLKYKTVVIGLQDAFDIDPKDSRTVTWNVAVGRDLAAAQAVYRRSLPNHEAGTVSGRVLGADGKPVAGVPVFVEQKGSAGDDIIGQAYSQDDGAYRIELPVGTYTLHTIFAGQHSAKQPVTIAKTGAATLDLQASPSGSLSIEVRDKDSDALLPVKLSILRLDEALPSIAEEYGPPRYSGGATIIEYPHTGKATVALPPGRYKVSVSRGFFYDLWQQEVEIKAGESQTLKGQLQEVVKLPKYMSGDFHIHAQASPDSQDPNQLKVAAMAGEGLGLAVSTDHEFVTDYQPVIAEMGLETMLKAVVGEEVTTFYGHFNTYPIPFQPDALNNGAFQWYLREAPAMFEFVSKAAPDAIIQINHPRGLPAGSYFSYVDYDPTTGKARKRPQEWSWKFHAIELVNGNDFGSSLTSTIVDWYSMLNRGMKITGMGNSDSHEALTSECGAPRNMLQLGSNDPKALTMAQLASTIKGQKVVVSGGAMIHLTASATGDATTAVGLGQLLTLNSEKVHLHLRIEAAPWIQLDKVTLIANGKSIWEQTLTVTDQVIRFDQTVALTLPKDAWIIAMTTGTKTIEPVAPGHKPFAFTNPIYIDVDQNKRFDPPETLAP